MAEESSSGMSKLALSNDTNEQGIADVPLSPSITNNNDSVYALANDTTNASAKDDVDALLQELDTTPNKHTNNDIEDPMSKLRESTTSLTNTLTNITSNLDTKYQISRQTSDLNSKLGISRATSQISSWWDGIQSMESTRNLKSNVSNVVGESTKTISEHVDKTGIKEVVGREVEKLEKVDDDLGIRKGAINFLADGVALVDKGLKQSLSGVGSNVGVGGEDHDDLLMAGDLTKDILDDIDAADKIDDSVDETEEDYDALLTASRDEQDGKTRSKRIVVEDDQVGGDKPIAK